MHGIMRTGDLGIITISTLDSELVARESSEYLQRLKLHNNEESMMKHLDLLFH